MKRLVLLFAAVCAISCIDKAYDLDGNVDMHATVLPGMTLDVASELDIPTDTLFSFSGYKSVKPDEGGVYRFIIPELRLVNADFSDKELVNGVTIDKSFIVKTHIDMPEILDSQTSSFVLDRMLLKFGMNNNSPYTLVVEATLIIGEQNCKVSFTSLPGSKQSHETSCKLRMLSLPTEFEIADIHIQSSDQTYKGDGSYRIGIDAQPQVPLSFSPGSILNCNFHPDIFVDQIIYDARNLEFNYVVSNPMPFDLQFVFSMPHSEDFTMVMDKIPAGANNLEVKMFIKSKDYILDRKDKLDISLKAVNSGDEYGELKSGGKLKMNLKNVVFPEGIIIR